MSARGFRSVIMVGGVAGAALSCYLVSLNVASERAELERVESRIVLAQRELRVLQTEIGTRGRLAQLERWNASVIRLSAPTADQFAADGFQLATLAKPDSRPVIDAPMVFASASEEQAPRRATATTDAANSPPPGQSPADMMHVASYSRPASPKPAISAKPEMAKVPAAKPAATKPAKTAMSDPLGPLPSAKAAGKAAPTAKPAATKPAATKPKSATKETGTP